MKFNSLFRETFLLGFLLSSSVAKTNECSELEEYSLNINKDCEMNKNGHITSLYFHDYNNIPMDLSKYTYLKTLTIEDMDEIYDILKDEKHFELPLLPSVEEFNLYNYRVYSREPYKTDNGDYVVMRTNYDNFTLPDSIKKLNINGLNISQTNLNEICQLPNLKELILRYCYLGDDDHPLNFDVFKKSNIQSFSIGTDYDYSDTYDYFYDQIYPPVNLIPSLTTLKKLEISNLRLHQYQIEEISALTQLETLSMDRLIGEMDYPDFTPLDWTSLQNLKNLKEFSFSRKAFLLNHDEFLENLPKNLKKLDLRFLDLNQKQFEEIFKFENLEELYLEFVKIGHFNPFDPFEILEEKYYNLSSFSKLSQLKKLIITYSSKVENIASVKELKKLEYLTLPGEGIKVSDIDAILSLKNLKELHLEYENVDYTLETINDLKKKLSKVSTTTTKKSVTTSIKKSTTTTSSPKPTSTVSGRCGPQFGACAKSNECCSKHGWCGKSEAHCGAGCQSEFGTCNSSSSAPTTTKKTVTTTKKTTTTTTTTTKRTTTTKKTPTSTVSGRCGPQFGACAKSNECCSQYGWCGKSEAHCGVGCQSEFGTCNSSSSSAPTTTKKAVTTSTKKNTTTTKKTTTKKPITTTKRTTTSKKTTTTKKITTSKKTTTTKRTTTSKKSTTTKKITTSKKTTTTKRTTTSKKSTTTKKITTSKKVTTSKKTTTSKRTTTTKKIPTSTVSGKCGSQYGACAKSNECCSQYGWCGKTTAHCGVGCQPKYGLCN